VDMASGDRHGVGNRDRQKSTTIDERKKKNVWSIINIYGEIENVETRVVLVQYWMMAGELRTVGTINFLCHESCCVRMFAGTKSELQLEKNKRTNRSMMLLMLSLSM
jgi:hypothetical protein